MTSNISFTNLHLQCRLWIAELNWEINILRIYGDYLQGLSTDKDNQDLKAEIKRHEQQFTQVRQEIDDLRNDLHLLKMKLATFVRDKKSFDQPTLKTTTYADMKKKVVAFKKSFDKLKGEMNMLEGQVAA